VQREVRERSGAYPRMWTRQSGAFIGAPRQAWPMMPEVGLHAEQPERRGAGERPRLRAAARGRDAVPAEQGRRDVSDAPAICLPPAARVAGVPPAR
jgi:hypothetical protein